MGVDEDHLSNRLVPPEAVDDPNRPFTKGEKQPSACRDAWAAILFYAQAIAIIAVCVIYGVPALHEQLNDAGQQGQDESTGDLSGYEGIAYLVMSAAGCAFVLSGISLALMSCCPKFLIQLSLLVSVAISFAMCVAAFMFGGFVGGAFAFIIFALSACYAWCVWSRIPFAAANLNTGLTAVKSNGFLFVMSYLFVAVTWVYSCVWFLAVLGVSDVTNAIDENGVVNQENMPWYYFALLLLGYFWSEQVLQNTMHAIVAGVVSTWWFVPQEASSFCSQAIMGSAVRATTTSFGSICFGSLLVAILQTIRHLIQSARNDSDVDGCGAIMLCLAECLIRCFEEMLEYFNKFAYIYVGMYGYSYLEAGKNVFNLFKQKGWTVIINDDLISNTLALFNLVVGLLVGAFGFLMKDANPDWFASFPDDGSATVVAIAFPFLVGLVISAVMFSVVDSSVNTVVVCFAEGPAEFEENHPDLSHEMREGWRKVYPEECGF